MLILKLYYRPRKESAAKSALYIKLHLHLMAAPRTTSIAVKRSSKPVPTTTTRALITNEKAMLPSFQRHFGLTKPIGKNPNYLGNCHTNHPLQTRGKGLHAVSHRKTWCITWCTNFILHCLRLVSLLLFYMLTPLQDVYR